MIEKANLKLLKEMDSNNNSSIEHIHVYLNQNMDDQLAKEILNKDKTIQSAYDYVYSKAREQAKGNQSTMVPKETVYEWVKEFYLNDDIKVKKAIKEVKKAVTNKKKTSNIRKSKKSTEKKENDYEQMSLFSF